MAFRLGAAERLRDAAGAEDATSDTRVPRHGAVPGEARCRRIPCLRAGAKHAPACNTRVPPGLGRGPCRPPSTLQGAMLGPVSWEECKPTGKRAGQPRCRIKCPRHAEQEAMAKAQNQTTGPSSRLRTWHSGGSVEPGVQR